MHAPQHTSTVFVLQNEVNSSLCFFLCCIRHNFLLAEKDFYSTGNNLEWRPGNSVPFNRFLVPIIDDDIPEPVEVLEIVVKCEDKGNCYLPRQTYTITIIDDQGMYNCHACLYSIGTV